MDIQATSRSRSCVEYLEMQFVKNRRDLPVRTSRSRAHLHRTRVISLRRSYGDKSASRAAIGQCESGFTLESAEVSLTKSENARNGVDNLRTKYKARRSKLPRTGCRLVNLAGNWQRFTLMSTGSTIAQRNPHPQDADSATVHANQTTIRAVTRYLPRLDGKVNSTS